MPIINCPAGNFQPRAPRPPAARFSPDARQVEPHFAAQLRRAERRAAIRRKLAFLLDELIEVNSSSH